MKVRELKEILKTSYYLINRNDELQIGSDYVRNLITVSKTDLTVTILKGWEDLTLKSIANQLVDLRKNGKLRKLMDEDDDLENPLPVFYTKGGRIYETTTDDYGYPNTTKEGYLMYDNTFFKTKHEALAYLCEEMAYKFKMIVERLEYIEKQVKEIREDNIDEAKSFIDTIKTENKK